MPLTLGSLALIGWSLLLLLAGVCFVIICKRVVIIFFFCDMSLEAACFSFVELILLTKVAFVTSGFCFCFSVFYTDFFQNGLW